MQAFSDEEPQSEIGYLKQRFQDDIERIDEIAEQTDDPHMNALLDVSIDALAGLITALEHQEGGEQPRWRGGVPGEPNA